MRPLSLALVTLLLGCAPAFGQTVTAETIGKQKTGVVPIELSVPVPPTAFRGDGVYHLCYEIHLANLSSITWRVQNIEVMNQSGGLLLTVAGKGLDGVLFHPARARDAKAAPGADIAPGEAVIAYMWVDLAKDAALPSGLQNQISVKTGDTADVAEAEVPSVKVLTQVPEITSPLRGKNWVAGNGPSNTSQHRRAMIVVDGTPHIAQRYAIDWVQTAADYKTYHGDPKDNRSYYCFGQEAHAIADATVVEVKDGIPENVPNEKAAVPITLETIAGNHVNLDLGGGVYAMYAHLQPGSIRVKVGDKVKTGQVLGLVGNTGNSSEPHLHFQLMNANSPLGSEGLPYTLSYQYEGKMSGEGEVKLDKAGAPQTRHEDIPMEDELVDFDQ
jgi:hypothetical protein